MTDVELQEDARMLPSGEQGVVWLSATQGGPDGELVFSRVCSKFFQTMASRRGTLHPEGWGHRQWRAAPAL